MKKNIPLIIILSLIATGLISSIGFEFNIEARSYFWKIVNSGFLTFLGLSLLFFYLLIKKIIKRKFLVGFLVLAPALLMSTCTVMSTKLYPEYHDSVIYESKEGLRIIIQYYETGITGNSRKRIIKTSKEYLSIRPYELLDNKYIPDSVKLADRGWELTIPPKLIIDNTEYELKDINKPLYP